MPARLLDHVQAHRHVRVEEPARLGAVRADPADLGREVHDDLGAARLEQRAHRVGVGEVAARAARHDQLARAALLELRAHAAAEEPGAAGHEDPPPANVLAHDRRIGTSRAELERASAQR